MCLDMVCWRDDSISIRIRAGPDSGLEINKSVCLLREPSQADWITNWSNNKSVYHLIYRLYAFKLGCWYWGHQRRGQSLDVKTSSETDCGHRPSTEILLTALKKIAIVYWKSLTESLVILTDLNDLTILKIFVSCLCRTKHWPRFSNYCNSIRRLRVD